MITIIGVDIMKNSMQRNIILKIVQDNCNHPDAYTIYELARKELPRISLGTVYRNLNLLSELGSIKKIIVPNGNDRFDKTIINHSHFFCTKCSQVFDIEVNLDSKTIEIKNECKIISEDIVLNGICPKCLKEE